MGRKDLVDLRGTTLQEFDACCPPELIVRRSDSVPIYRDIRTDDLHGKGAAPSRVYFRGIEDWSSIGSEQYSWALLDEAQEIPTKSATYLFSRLRHRPERKWGMVFGFNPFPSWCTQWLYEDGFPKELMDELERRFGRVVISLHTVEARIRDNPYLPPGYEQMLRVAMANDPYMLSVMIDGEHGAVPNAIFAGQMRNRRTDFIRDVPVADLLGRTQAAVAIDYGTTFRHKLAVVAGYVHKSGRIVITSAAEDPTGDTKWMAQELGLIQAEIGANAAVVDRSQFSLRETLIELGFHDVDKGQADVDFRIGVLRGLFSREAIVFRAGARGILELWNYLLQYHRDDDGKIVEEKDDMIDALLYLVVLLSGLQPDLTQKLPTQSYAPDSVTLGAFEGRVFDDADTLFGVQEEKKTHKQILQERREDGTGAVELRMEV